MNRFEPWRVRTLIEERRDEILEWTGRLISFPSENRPPAGGEGEAQDWLAGECRSLGLEVDRFRPDSVEGIEEHPSWLPGRSYENGRENVVVCWPGSRAPGDTENTGEASTAKSLLLSGHVDVAPLEPDNWKVTRPFTPLIQDGRLYGRGSADMKGGLAAAFWAVKLLKELSFEPAADLYFESVVDEEFAGGNGTLASRLKGYNADLAVYMEPSAMEICPAGLGAFLGDLRITGNAGMPFTGYEIANPVFAAGRVIELFSEWLEIWRGENSHRLFTGPGKQLNLMLWNLSSSSPGLTVQMGTPETSKISWIVWCYPGMTENKFYDGFVRYWKDKFKTDDVLKPFEFEITPTYHFIKPWESDVEGSAVQCLQSVYEEYTGARPVIAGAPFSSDLALYGETGRMPAVILGPRGDNLHGPDEWVLTEDILELTGIFTRLVVSLCS